MKGVKVLSKPKNLNKNSKRAFLLQQKEMIEKELSESLELSKSDLKQQFNFYLESLKENEFASNTVKIYTRAALSFIDSLPPEEIVTKDHVIKFKDYLLKKYSKVQTINSYITGLNRFLFFADLGEFKVVKVKGQGENTLKYRIYSHEYKRLWMKAKALNSMPLYFAIRLMGETGVRADELKSFNAKTVFENHVSVDNKGKIRRVPIPGELGRELRRYVKTMKMEDDVIVNINYDTLNKSLKKIAGLCKIKKAKVHPHALRHYFGFNFVEKKGDLKLAQLSDILGHSSVETTRIYTRGTLEDYLKAVEDIR